MDLELPVCRYIKKMDENEAIIQFQELLRGVKADDRKNFLNWIKNSIIGYNITYIILTFVLFHCIKCL